MRESTAIDESKRKRKYKRNAYHLTEGRSLSDKVSTSGYTEVERREANSVIVTVDDGALVVPLSFADSRCSEIAGCCCNDDGVGTGWSSFVCEANAFILVIILNCRIEFCVTVTYFISSGIHLR